MWDEIQDMSGEIFDFEDVPAEVRNDPDFAFKNDLDDDHHDENSRKALQASAILRGYTLQQVKLASAARLRRMVDPSIRRCRRTGNHSKLALMA